MLERRLELAAARITMSAFNAACFRSVPHDELYFSARTIHIPCGKVDSLGLAAPPAISHYSCPSASKSGSYIIRAWFSVIFSSAAKTDSPFRREKCFRYSVLCRT